MKEIPSTEFRGQYAKLTESTVVTVHGHVIGTWTPGPSSAFSRGVLEGARIALPKIQAANEQLAKLPGGGVQARQAQRDALLGRINRSK